MKNNNAEKLEALPKGVVYELKEIIKIIELLLISNRRKPYTNDWFNLEYFDKFSRLRVIELLTKLDKDFNILLFYIRTDTDKAVHIGLKSDEDTTDFFEFKKLIDEVYTGPEQISKMTFVEPEKKLFKIIINNDYSEVWNADRKINYYELLASLALNGGADKTIHKGTYDQLNNREKTPFKKNYIYSQIIKSEKNKITPNIEFEVINNREFREREVKSGL